MPKTTLKSNPNELVMASGVGESEMPAVAGYAPAIYGALSAIMDEIGAMKKVRRMTISPLVSGVSIKPTMPCTPCSPRTRYHRATGARLHPQ